MKKEAIVVGIFGLALGLLVAWGVWNFKALPQKRSPTPTPLPTTQSPTPSQPSFFLNLTSPEEETLATTPAQLVSGKTRPQSLILVGTNLEDQIATSGADGTFQVTVKLEEGNNLISVTAYGLEGEETVEREVFYTKEEI